MARILAVSSFVAHGHVGLAAMVPALQALGHEVIAVPTVVLSSHYGYANVEGVKLDCPQISRMLDALAANGWLQTVDAVLTGYLPSREVAELLAATLQRLGDADDDLLYLCDPVLGDDPHGLYVPESVAAAIRDLLVPLADIVTPNRFELEWLSGKPVRGVGDVRAAAGAISDAMIVATSVPAAAGEIANVFGNGREWRMAAVPLAPRVPHGTGDLFAALLLGHLLDARDTADAVARATAGVRRVIDASAGANELRLVGAIREAIEAEQPWCGAD